MVLITASCTMSWTSINSSSGTLSISPFGQSQWTPFSLDLLWPLGCLWHWGNVFLDSLWPLGFQLSGCVCLVSLWVSPLPSTSWAWLFPRDCVYGFSLFSLDLISMAEIIHPAPPPPFFNLISLHLPMSYLQSFAWVWFQVPTGSTHLDVTLSNINSTKSEVIHRPLSLVSTFLPVFQVLVEGNTTCSVTQVSSQQALPSRSPGFSISFPS